MIGKALGNGEYDEAYLDSKRLMEYGLAGSLILSVALVLLGKYYVLIYNVDTTVRAMAYQLLVVFAIVSPIKVQNILDIHLSRYLSLVLHWRIYHHIDQISKDQ